MHTEETFGGAQTKKKKMKKKKDRIRRGGGRKEEIKEEEEKWGKARNVDDAFSDACWTLMSNSIKKENERERE